MRYQIFRSIIYGYMSCVRRADAKLHFPDRTVALQRAYAHSGLAQANQADIQADPGSK